VCTDVSQVLAASFIKAKSALGGGIRHLTELVLRLLGHAVLQEVKVAMTCNRELTSTEPKKLKELARSVQKRVLLIPVLNPVCKMSVFWTLKKKASCFKELWSFLPFRQEAL
jgi:hypothetical protein